MAHRVLYHAGVILLLATSCKFIGKKKSDRRSKPQASEIINVDSMVIKRFNDGQQASVKFSTKTPVYCRVKFFHLEGDTRIHPKELDCPNNVAANFFEVSLELAQPELPIETEVEVWIGEDKDNVADTALAREDANLVRKLLFPITTLATVRFDVPSRLAEIQLAQLTNPMSKKLLLESVRPELNGCNTQPPSGPGLESDGTLPVLETIASRGFSVGTDEPHPTDPHIRRMSLSSLFWDQVWEWDFKADDTSYSFKSLQAGNLQLVTLSNSLQSRTLDKASLEKPASRLTVDLALPLQVQWNYSDLPLDSYVRIQIGLLPSQLECVFNAEQGVASISAEDLAVLGESGLASNTELPIFVALETQQVQTANERQDVGWLIRTSDWKTGIAVLSSH